MEDLQNKITEILGDPQALQQLQSLGNMLGLSQTPQNDISIKCNEPKSNSKESSGFDLSSAFSDETLGIITKIMPLLSKVKQDDEVTHLLEALRPFLGAERQKKLDEAKKMLSMMKLLPLVKDIGLF